MKPLSSTPSSAFSPPVNTAPRATASQPPMVAWLGYGGLIPFVCLPAAALAGGDVGAFCSRALLAYGAVILCFVGALHWGFAMALPAIGRRRRNQMWSWSVVPALLAWVALLLAPAAGGVLMVAGFLVQYRQDRRLVRKVSLPPWYLALRLRLTLVACACLLEGVVASFRPAVQ